MSSKDEEDQFRIPGIRGVDDDKLKLLKALRRSQTRAREAEARCAVAVQDRASLSFAVVEESMRVFAYQQMMRLLELHIRRLQSESQPAQGGRCEWRKAADGVEELANGEGCGLTWVMSITFCFGMAEFCYALGYRFFF